MCLLAAVFNNNNKPIQHKNAWWANKEFLFIVLPPLFLIPNEQKCSASPQKINKLRREKKKKKETNLEHRRIFVVHMTIQRTSPLQNAAVASLP